MASKKKRTGSDSSPSGSSGENSDTPREDEVHSVILHNDETTTMEHVVFILTTVFDKTPDTAKELMLQVHNNGRAVAGKYSPALAEGKAMVVERLSRSRNFPLQCTVEDEDGNEVTIRKKKPMRSQSPECPPGWFMAGSDPADYQVTIDRKVFHSGSKCATVTHAVEKPGGFGTLMQMFSARNYRGKRLRLKMWVKSQDVEGSVQPWFRVDGRKREESLSFDNTCNRATKGTTDWKEYQLVLDVPESSTNLAFGIMLMGRGRLWVDDIEFEVVGTDVEVTDCPCHTKRISKRLEAQNLNFEDEPTDDGADS